MTARQDAGGRDRERLFPPMNGRLFGETMDGEPTAPYAACYDCGRTYGDAYGFPDLIVPNDVWQRISPTGDEGGLLCPSCIVRRCAQEGIECEARWRSGPFAEYNRLAAADPEGECATCGDSGLFPVTDDTPPSYDGLDPCPDCEKGKREAARRARKRA